jgi:hypothetical protein
MHMNPFISFRHCERSEAIQYLDRRVAALLAMTSHGADF